MEAKTKEYIGYFLVVLLLMVAVLFGACATWNSGCKTAEKIMEERGYVVLECQSYWQEGIERTACLVFNEKEGPTWKNVSRDHCMR